MNMKMTPELQNALVEFYQACSAADFLAACREPTNDVERITIQNKREAAQERQEAAKAEVQYQIIRADTELQSLGAAPQLARMTPEAWAALRAFYDAGSELLKVMQGADLGPALAGRILPRFRIAAQAYGLARDALHMNSKTKGVTR
jgi:hypothetical protein